YDNTRHTDHKSGVQDGRYADLNGLRFSLGKTKTYRDKVTGTLCVDGEQCRKSQLRRDIAFSDLHTNHGTDYLRDNGSRSKQCGKHRDGADEAQDDQADSVSCQRNQEVCEPVTKTGS